ncbi:hypothetical protein AMECASPLE_036667, partial [Ameca splendens]
EEVLLLLLEEETREEQQPTEKDMRATEVSPETPPTPQKQDTKTELTDTAVDGDLTVTESDQDEDLRTQETLGSPEENLQTTISALRRSFLEGDQGGGGMTEWEKRLASSPLRRADEAPMIEPLELEEGGGFVENQAAAQPIREKHHTMGRSYDTTTGRVLSMLTEDDVTMTTASVKPGHLDRCIPVSATDDVITGGPLGTLREVKTPTSPLESLPAVYDVTSMDEGGVFVMSSLAPLTLPKSPLGGLGPTPRASPSTTRLVCWLAWKQA